MSKSKPPGSGLKNHIDMTILVTDHTKVCTFLEVSKFTVCIMGRERKLIQNTKYTNPGNSNMSHSTSMEKTKVLNLH